MSTIGSPRDVHHTMPRGPGSPPAGPPRGIARWLIPVLVVAIILAGSAIVYLVSRPTNQGVAPASSTAAQASASAPAAATQSQAPATTAASASATASAVPGQVRAIPVYYLADVAGGPRLYREFHSLTVLAGGPALTAVTEMLRGAPVDADYRSAWPTTVTVRSLTVAGDVATVDLSGFVALGAAYESAAVQQLVYTVTAAEPAVHQVKLLVNGAVPASGHTDWSKPVSRANALDVMAFVWILAPTQGATVSSPVAVTVYGTGFEGNVPLKVFQGSTVVASTQVTTMMGGFAEARTTITLPPGTYELRAYNDNGRDSSLQLWDTKTFTVR